MIPCIAMLIHNKDDVEFVTEFTCLLGHPAKEEKMYLNQDSQKSLCLSKWEIIFHHRS